MPLPVLFSGRRKRGNSGPSYAVFDTFTDANSTALPSHAPEIRPGANAWVNSLGTWQIQSNAARLTATAGDNQNVAVIDAGIANGSISSTIKRVSNSDYGVVVNYTDQNNFWMCIRYITDLIIYERSAGSFFSRATVVLAQPGVGVDEVISAVTSGDTIEMYVNGVLQCSYTVAARPHKTATKHGIRVFTDSGAQGDFLDFSVR